MDHPNYQKAPITEAIIEIRVRPQHRLTAVDVAVGFQGIVGFNAEYTERQEIIAPPEISFLIEADAPPAFGFGPTLGGFRFISPDKQRIIQARTDMMSFSVVCEPETETRYKRWAEFLPEAKKAWKHYVAATKPIEVTRVGMRYVNRFVFPQTRVELSDYFITYPPEPDKKRLIYSELAFFNFQIVMPQPDIDAVVIVNQNGPIVNSNDGKIAVILDIDVFRDNLSLVSDDDEAMWMLMERLHSRRNDVFESCITDKMRELIK